MTNVTIEGNTTDIPTLGYTHSGIAYASFTVAVNIRRFDRSKGEWVSREPVFHRVVAFGDLAENVANSLQKGTALIVVGELVDDSWTDGDGRKQPRTQIEARNIAPSLRNATAQVTKLPRRQPAEAAAE